MLDHDQSPPGASLPHALARNWRVVVALVLVGIGLGVVAGALHTTQYTAEARLVVGTGDLAAYEVPGYALASQQLAGDYARYVDNSSTLTQRLRTSLGSQDGDLVGVTSSPIADSNVVRIEVTATSSDAAVRGAQILAKDLVTEARKSAWTQQPAALLAQYADLSRQSSQAQVTATRLQRQLDQARQHNRPTAELEQKVAEAGSNLDLINLRKSAVANTYQSSLSAPQSQSQLSVIQPAAISGDDGTRYYELTVALGLVVGLVIGIAVAAALERGRQQGRTVPAPHRARRSRPSPESVGQPS